MWFLYFSTLYSAEGAESAWAIPNAQAKQSSRPTVLSDSNWPHWWQRHRMFGVIGLHWEPSYRHSPQHHCISHWSCLIGRSTCKSYSGWKLDDFMDLIILFDPGAQTGSSDRIFTLHYDSLSHTGLDMDGLNFYCQEHNWQTSLVPCSYIKRSFILEKSSLDDKIFFICRAVYTWSLQAIHLAT